MKLTNYLIISSLSHALIAVIAVLLLAGGNANNKNENNGNNNGNQDHSGDIKPKQSEEEQITEVEIVKVPGPRKPKPKHAEDTCPSFFGGIGVVTVGNVIIKAPPGYPAYDNGIREGERMI